MRTIFVRCRFALSNFGCCLICFVRIPIKSNEFWISNYEIWNLTLTSLNVFETVSILSLDVFCLYEFRKINFWLPNYWAVMFSFIWINFCILVFMSKIKRKKVPWKCSFLSNLFMFRNKLTFISSLLNAKKNLYILYV